MNKKSISAFFFAWLNKLILFYVDKYGKKKNLNWDNWNLQIYFIYYIKILWKTKNDTSLFFVMKINWAKAK